MTPKLFVQSTETGDRGAQNTVEPRLIEVAIELFGRQGFDGVSTRAIAKAADSQMSAITYHFKNKRGLYNACASSIARTMREKIGPVLEEIDAAEGDSHAQARIEILLGGLVNIMMREDVASISRFVVREQMAPSTAFQILYEGAMGAVVERICRSLVTLSRGKLAHPELQVRAIALMGQVFAFRFARAAVLRTTGWKEVGMSQTRAVREVVLKHTRAVLEALQQESKT